MALVAERWGLIPELQAFAHQRARPVWGTCAGLIFLANRATGEAGAGLLPPSGSGGSAAQVGVVPAARRLPRSRAQRSHPPLLALPQRRLRLRHPAGPAQA